MAKKTKPSPKAKKDFAAARGRWEGDYAETVSGAAARVNRSGIEVKPLYTPDDWPEGRYMEDLGFPGQAPGTRGVYPSMHRGRPWSQRQLVGLATPEEYNARMRLLVGAGATALSLIPCNSVYRGFDVDEVDPLLLGTCGTTINTVEDMTTCLDGVPLEKTSIALNDPSPFTLLAFLLCHARRIGLPWASISGTSNQSDYISHFVANHMFFRIALPGSRRVFTDHVAFTNRHLPKWNPVSVVGQHMQQAGATPAEAMAFTFSTAIQYAEDCIGRGLDPDVFLPRFTFFFDVSISFFEEIAKFRAGRRLWARITRERWKTKNPRSGMFKFHGQTSGVDLTRQQPLNNISRVALQALAAVLGGCQSLHADAYDEVFSSPAEEAARVAVATQNILREEAHLADVIDPLGGSYYLETLTNAMEEKIEGIMAEIDAVGGMFAAVEAGLVQRRIGESAARFQQKIDSGEQKIVGVNAYQVDEEAPAGTMARPDPKRIAAHIAGFKAFKESRSRANVNKALDGLARVAASAEGNVFEQLIEAADAGATHGEICTCLRRELGVGEPLVAA
ncbi:MAG: acyl-CoA mutase large subunit family protein [Proteobacteria bacterium]|nr:acyl-CoA mutase large subunit family protein [Pseudomonadota bacterium]